MNRLLLGALCAVAGVILLPVNPWTSAVLVLAALVLVLWDNYLFRRDERRREAEWDASIERLESLNGRIASGEVVEED